LHYRSVFITGAGSSIYSLSNLKGKQFAFGDIDLTALVWWLICEPMQAGINPNTDFKFRHGGSHLATAAMVEDGVVDAGAIDETVFNFLVISGKLDRKRVRIFYTSIPYVDYVYARMCPRPSKKNLPAPFPSQWKAKDHPVLEIFRATQFVAANDKEYASWGRWRMK
jgi:phosphonate transport system substrate-binding protein